MTRKKKPSGKKTGVPRSLHAIKRRAGNREPRKVVLIICEGEKTEPLYFRSLRRSFRLSSVEVQIVPKQGAPLSIVRKAIQKKNDIEKGDEVWCVFDVEEKFQNTTFYDAVTLAQRSGIKLAVSNPSFEYWYLLHFEATSRPFQNAGEVIKTLKKHLPQYQKNLNVYEHIKKQTDIAIERASKLRTEALGHSGGDNFPNPSTYVDKLVTTILNIAQLPQKG